MITAHLDNGQGNLADLCHRLCFSSGPLFLLNVIADNMALHTPRQDPRRLSFGTNALSNLSNPAQSPYTPLSVPRSSVQSFISSPVSHPNTLTAPTPEPSEEAETFVSGGLKSRLRAISLRAVTIARQTVNKQIPYEVGLNYVAQIVEETTSQLALSESLCNAPSIRPSTRRHVAVLREHLMLELRTWTLLQAGWTLPQPRAADLVTRRLQLCATEALSFLDLPGIVKVQHVLEWLERAAATDLKQGGGPLVNPLDDPAYRWRYTAARFEDEPVSIDYPLCDDNDPLDEIERKAESRLAREVFRLVRAGMLEDAERVCREAGQPWRAAVLGGGCKASALAANGVRGAARRTWRRAATALATTKQAAVPKHERAVAGVLAGVLQPVLAVCTSYDDQLWAHLSVLLDGTVENFLSSEADVVISDDAILQTFQECKFSSEGVTAISPEVLQYLRHAHAYLALGSGISYEHRNQLLNILAKLAKSASEHRLEWAGRLAVQICLFLKYSGQLERVHEQDSIILNFDSVLQTYVHFVIGHEGHLDASLFQHSIEDRVSICAIAANFLAEMAYMDSAIETYSKIMELALRADLLQEAVEARRAKVAVQNIEESRVMCLQEAADCFDNSVLTELAIHTVDRVWRNNFDPALTEETSMSESVTYLPGSDERDDEPNKDEMTVRAIEFLTYSGFPNYEEALVRTTCATRRFFLLQKREMARRVIAWFPRDVLDELEQGSHNMHVREFQCWELYFRAVSCHNDWYLYQANNRPGPIPDSVRRAALTQPVQNEATEKLQIYNTALRDYEKVCTDLREVAVTSLYDALFFNQGWMANVTKAETEGDNSEHIRKREDRRNELDTVCKIGIPELVSLLHNVFHKSGLFRDAADLVTLVAEEDLKLYNHFKPGDMKKLLAKVAASAVNLADETIKTNTLTYPYEGTFFEEFGTSKRRESQRVTFAER